MAPVAPDVGDLLHIGQIHAAYGLKGWVWVYSHTDPMANLFAYSPWYIREHGVFRQVKPVEWREQGKGLVMRLEGCADRNGAEALHGVDLWAPRASLPTLESGDYYWSDLADRAVYTVDGQCLGAVHAMMETGSNDVMVVRGNAGAVDRRERLIPWLPGSVVVSVDLAANRIVVDWDPEF